MFTKILIANRGEIACRVIRTCRRLGIRTVAVYSEADNRARHARLADEAWPIGGPRPQDSYLRGDAIIEVAKQSGAQAIHPGYGFLSENADFAEAVEAAGLVFIGPNAASMRKMGSKAGAKQLMAERGVPVVPGYTGENQDPAHLQQEADRVGYPQMIKAAHGGGGKGMRIVHDSAGFAAALESCQREAASAFGRDRVLIERYIREPRHIEIQVFGDSHGSVIHLNERECSAQRRYQKVVEESPSPFLTPELRARMGAAAVQAAHAIDYVNAGTVEFIVGADGDFFFMEINTRLQVEHPVTELVTGLDLVEWQLRIAAGEPLALRQEDVRSHGHAIEVRLYAEDPSQNFLPGSGRLETLRLPEASAHVRLDAGVVEGDTVTIFYDPMIAKLITWDLDRPRALPACARRWPTAKWWGRSPISISWKNSCATRAWSKAASTPPISTRTWTKCCPRTNRCPTRTWPWPPRPPCCTTKPPPSPTARPAATRTRPGPSATAGAWATPASGCCASPTAASASNCTPAAAPAITACSTPASKP